MNTGYAALMQQAPRQEYASSSNAATQNGASHPYTLKALQRWSCIDEPLPPVETTSVIHIYDFDNTLFASPLPNALIWDPKTASKLQGVSPFVNGGWWHDAGILSSTGDGAEIEEQRAWQGWWNEDVVKNVRDSWRNRANTVSILLTGRSEKGFAELIQRMVRSKDLHFHMICLKPQVMPNNVKVTSTLQYKTELFKSLILTYSLTTRLVIWEDRQHHVQKFNAFMNKFNQELRNGPKSRRTTGIIHSIKVITGLVRPLDQIAEISAIQRTINAHNRAVLDGSAPSGCVGQKIVPMVAYTAYHIPDGEARKALCRLANPPIHPDIVIQPSHILLNTAALAADKLSSLSGIGSKAKFKTTAFGSHGGNVWAIKVQCTDSYMATKIAQACNVKCLYVLVARRKLITTKSVDKISQWHAIPAKAQVTFEAVLGERVLLEVVEEDDEVSDLEPDVNVQPSAQPVAGQKRVYEEISSSSEGEIDETGGYLALNTGNGPPIPSGPKAQRTGISGRRNAGNNNQPTRNRQVTGGNARAGYDNHRGRGAPAARGRVGRGAPTRVKGKDRHKPQYQDLDQNGGLGAGGNGGGFDY